MKSFVKVNVGNRVFDSTQQVEGIVKYVNYETNIAQVVIDPLQEEIVLCKLANLTVLGNDKTAQTEYEDKYIKSVTEFHVAFDHPVASSPTPLTLERATSRAIWSAEELVEFIESSSSNEEEFLQAYDTFLAGVEKAKQKSLESGSYPQNDTDRIVAQSDALTDANYFNFGSFVELGIKPDPLFDIVQSANMSKLFKKPDGTKYAKYRESDGKILKSPEFFSPEPLLEKEVLRQMNENK